MTSKSVCKGGGNDVGEHFWERKKTTMWDEVKVFSVVVHKRDENGKLFFKKKSERRTNEGKHWFFIRIIFNET